MSEAAVAFPGSPTAWKKMEVILMKQVKVMRERKTRKVWMANSQYSGLPWPKMPTTSWGQSSKTSVAARPTARVVARISWYVLRTRSYFSAP